MLRRASGVPSVLCAEIVTVTNAETGSDQCGHGLITIPPVEVSPGDWTCDDADAARLDANGTARPWGSTGPTPEEAWQCGTPVLSEDRAALTEMTQIAEAEARQAQGYSPTATLDRTAQAALSRIAIRKALVKLGFLTLERPGQ